MKNSKLSIALIVVFVAVIFFDTAFAVDVELTDSKEIKTNVTDFKNHLHDSCGGVTYYIGVPRETNFYQEFLEVSTPDYIVSVPFKIIQQVTKTDK